MGENLRHIGRPFICVLVTSLTCFYVRPYVIKIVNFLILPSEGDNGNTN